MDSVARPADDERARREARHRRERRADPAPIAGGRHANGPALQQAGQPPDLRPIRWARSSRSFSADRVVRPSARAGGVSLWRWWRRARCSRASQLDERPPPPISRSCGRWGQAPHHLWRGAGGRPVSARSGRRRDSRFTSGCLPAWPKSSAPRPASCWISARVIRCCGSARWR